MPKAGLKRSSVVPPRLSGAQLFRFTVLVTTAWSRPAPGFTHGTPYPPDEEEFPRIDRKCRMTVQAGFGGHARGFVVTSWFRRGSKGASFPILDSREWTPSECSDMPVADLKRVPEGGL